MEVLLKQEFDKILAELPVQKYHRQVIDIRFPRGWQTVFYADKKDMTEEEFKVAVQKECDENWKEICSY